MLEPSPITKRSLGIGATRATARNVVNAIVAAAMRHRVDFTPAATSRSVPNAQEITDCTAHYCAAAQHFLRLANGAAGLFSAVRVLSCFSGVPKFRILWHAGTHPQTG